jgi:hypothetical protein
VNFYSLEELSIWVYLGNIVNSFCSWKIKIRKELMPIYPYLQPRIIHKKKAEGHSPTAFNYMRDISYPTKWK